MRESWLPPQFFARDPLTCARELIGCELVWGECAGVVVETEAYCATGDEACHTHTRPSARTFIAQHGAGTAYVYFNYGTYWLLNVLVKGGGEDGFVLLRALQPTRGIPAMLCRRRLPRPSDSALCSGPGKLTIALGVAGADHGRNLCSGSAPGFLRAPGAVEVRADQRIGISRAQHLPWRFTHAASSCLSRPAREPQPRTGQKRSRPGRRRPGRP